MSKYDDALSLIETRVDAAVKTAGRRAPLVIYSAYNCDDSEDEVPIDNLDEVAAIDRVRLIGRADPSWGGPNSQEYRSEVLENPTWLQVTVCADAMIRVTKDGHHCFLEGIKLLPDAEQTEPGVTLWEFEMGS